MTAAGHTLTIIIKYEWVDVSGLRLPFSVFEVMDTPQPFYIYYCLWNDRFNTSGSEPPICRFAGTAWRPCWPDCAMPASARSKSRLAASTAPAKRNPPCARNWEKSSS